ncbi:MAG TPA: MFS transporter [Acidimicrobiales bacterium]|jgi:MFS family permease|nr:MFS transporter [Acidimicrobiales bacterium]
MRSLLADIGPLRRSAAFRRLWFGLSVTSLGSQLTVVGVAYQAYQLTHSTAMVGLVSLTGLLPTIFGSLVGGAVADVVDRRRLLIVTQVLLAAGSAALAANALAPHPQLWVLFVAPSATACLQGVDWPTRLAVVPMLVDEGDRSSAFALQSVVQNLAVVAGPALAGLLIADLGLKSVYLADVASYTGTFVAAVLLPPLKPQGDGQRTAGLRSIVDGLRFLRTENLLLATFVLDLNAMVFGMPKAVFPALGIHLFHGGASTVGLLYAAPGAGALASSLLSGWVKHITAMGRALVVCMLIWGGAIALFGIIPVLWIGLVLLALAGGADIIGGVFRVAILQKATPENMQGRLSGLFFAAAVSGNRLGDGESGLAATAGGSQFAVWTGGLACILGTVLLAWRIPQLWRQDGRPDPKLDLAAVAGSALVLDDTAG